MNVLSVFDGMSCGRIALARAGIPVTNYYASEIDKFAIQVSKDNWQDIEHVGDVTKLESWFLPWIDLLIGGSPCQGFSFAGQQLNFNDPRSKLFFEFVRLLKALRERNPKLKFFLENVVMKKEYQDVISKALGVQPILINSTLVSAQNRKRLYWTNIPFCGQPDDKRILLKDILQHPVDEKYYLSDKAIDYMLRYRDGRQRYKYHFNDPEDKACTLVACGYKGVPYNVVIEKAANIKQERSEEGRKIRSENIKAGKDFTPWSARDIVRRVDGKVCCLTASQGVEQLVEIADRWRRFTPNECERLQGVPDNYCNSVSETQAYKMLGNGWNIDTIVHLFTGLKYDWF